MIHYIVNIAEKINMKKNVKQITMYLKVIS